MIDEHKTEVETLRAQMMEWKLGVAPESAFWDRWMQGRGGQWHEDFTRRFDPETPLDPWIAAVARSMDQSHVKILDVGSGPVPAIGYKLDSAAVQITAVDPLASIYNQLLTRHGLIPPVAATFALAEELSSFFEPNSFDIVHSRNALDHSFDPLRGISEMLKVVRVGGLALLRHHRNEAENEKYRGFHHYNFDCRGSRFIVWSKSIAVDVGDFLKDLAKVSCTMPQQVEVMIQKISDLTASPEAPRDRMRHYFQAFIDLVA